MTENFQNSQQQEQGYPALKPPEHPDRLVRKESSPIKLVDQQPDASLMWQQIEEFLWFRRSYLNFPRCFSNPRDLIQMARMSVAGCPDQDIAQSLGISTDTVLRSTRLVERTLHLVPETAAIMKENHLPAPVLKQTEARVAAIYHRFKKVPGLIDQEKEQATELGGLFDENPHLESLFRYFASGRSVGDMVAEIGLGHTLRRSTRYTSDRVVGLFTLGNFDRTLHFLARSWLFSQCIRAEQSWYGISLVYLFTDAARFAIAIPPSQTENSRFFSNLAKFARLIPVLHLAVMKEQRWQADDIKTIFPEVSPEKPDPYELDAAAYYQRYRRWLILPEPVRWLSQAYMNGTMVPDIFNRLTAIGIAYPRDSLEAYAFTGLRFLENLLLVKGQPDNWRRYQGELTRSRSKEAARIISLFGERIKRLNQERKPKRRLKIL